MFPRLAQETVVEQATKEGEALANAGLLVHCDR